MSSSADTVGERDCSAEADDAAVARHAIDLLAAGDPVPWEVEKRALHYWISQDVGNLEQSATLWRRLREHGEAPPYALALSAMEYYLGQTDYPQGACQALVVDLSTPATIAPWSRISAALRRWGNGPQAVEAYSELLICAAACGRSLAEVELLIGSDAWALAYEHLAASGYMPFPELEVRALRATLARDPRDGAAAARLAHVLGSQGEAVDWAVERTALRHFLSEDPGNTDLAATLVQGLMLHNEPVGASEGQLALNHFLALRPPFEGAVSSVLRALKDCRALPNREWLREALLKRVVDLRGANPAVTDLFHAAMALDETFDAFLGAADAAEASVPASPLQPTVPDTVALENMRIAQKKVDQRDYLSARVPASSILYPNLKARFYGATLAAVSTLEREAAHDLALRVLLRPAGQSVGALLEDQSEFQLLPGSPYIHAQHPEALLNFIIDAWVRGRRALEFGAPPMLVFSMPKSGSSYSSAMLARLLDVPPSVASANHAAVMPNWLKFAGTYPSSLHDHALLSQDDLCLLRGLGVKRVALQIRDPRQAIISLAHHYLKAPIGSVMPALQVYRDKGFSRYLDCIIDLYAPKYALWNESWRLNAEAAGVDLVHLQYEAMALQPRAFFEALLDSFGAPGGIHDRLSAALYATEVSREGGQLNFRAGQTDDWQTILTPRQADRVMRLSGLAYDMVYDLVRPRLPMREHVGEALRAGLNRLRSPRSQA